MANGVIEVGADGEHPTFCRLCEAYCGLIADVKDKRVVAIRPDPQNPHSQGHVCVKGMAVGELTNDVDRLSTPMKRTGGPGEFQPVSWEEALSDIAARLGGILADHGGDALALYHGNPVGYATNFAMSTGPFLQALGGHKRYHSGSQDHHSRLVANYLSYGDGERNSFPDLVNCDFLMVLGANMLVSNGSLIFAPRLRHDLDAIAERGQVIVVDPRRTETARRYDHLPIKPNGDLWLLLGMTRVLIDEGLIDQQVITERTVGWDDLNREVLSIPLAEAAARSGVTEERIREMAVTFATTERAAIYGRLGLCRGPFATVTNFLLTTLNVVAGKFGKTGGTIFGHDVFAGTEKGKLHHYDTGRSRIGNVPAVYGTLSCAVLPADLLEEGEGRVRAMFMVGANPVLTAPGGKTLVEGLEGLDLFVSLDLYMNESNRYADYLLPGLTFLEREDAPLYGLFSLMRPFIQFGDAVVEPAGEARDEYLVLAEILRRLGKDMTAGGTPLAMFDTMLRNGPAGDHFGEREGWSFDRLREHPHGVMVDLPDPTIGWEEKIGYPDRRFRLWHEEIGTELARARGEPVHTGGLKLISRRDIRSMNSWMHNIPRLSRSQTPELLIHPDDATDHSIGEGDLVRIWNEHGEVQVSAALSTDMMRGVVCYPHGWKHEGGWQVANGKSGENINLLLGFGPDNVEPLAGMTLMDGIDVRVEKMAVPQVEPA